MNVTITAEQRAALWADVTQDLAGIDAIYLAIQDRRWATARALRCRFEQGMRLLDDIGWADRQPGEQFDITIPLEELRLTLQRLHDNALRGVETYADLLERLGDEPQPDPDAASA